MKHRILPLALLVLAGPGWLSACIQGAHLPPPKQQLPVDLFKLRFSATVEPIAVELSPMKSPSWGAIAQGEKESGKDYAAILARFEANPPTKEAYDERNDQAAALLYAHRYQEALVKLLDLEKDHPGKYATAANLGTAYELTGDAENALRWIKQGIERNPGSHAGTEWLHVAILETKLHLARDPSWLINHGVLDAHGNRTSADKARALEYQLNERLYFIRGNDPVMSDLFYEAARHAADAAKRDYFLSQASRFGSIRDEQIRALLGGTR